MESKLYQLGDLVEIGRGSSPRPITDEIYFKDGTIPWIKIADATSSGKYIYETKEHVNDYGASFSRKLNKDSLIIAASGTLGFPKFLGVSGCIHDGWMYFDNYKTNLINKDYLYYKLISLRDYFNNMSYGAAIQNINTPILRKTKLFLPELNIQQKIAEILNNYDQLIENNNRRIKILEDMAESLYKEWFVRFRHPIYKPSIGKVKNLCMIKSGFAFKSSDWIDNGVKVVKIKDINGNYVDSKSLDCVPIEVAKKAFRFQLNVGDLTIAMTGATIGKVGLVKDNGLYTNQRVGKFFVDKKHVPFLYCFFKQEHIVETIASISSSSAAQPNISGEDLENIDMPFNIELINEFSDKVSSMFNDVIRLLNINELLLTQRDALLPRLMSGKLEVAGGAN